MNKLSSAHIVGIGIGVVIAIIAIYAIISLIIDYRNETKKAEEMYANLKTANDFPVSNETDNSKNLKYNTYDNRFRDVGVAVNSSSNNGCNSGSYGNFQFVIIKSVIHTETREEIPYFQ